MIDLYEGLINIWENALPDNLSPLMDVERLSRGLSMLDGGKTGDAAFTNSVQTAIKIFRFMEKQNMEHSISLTNASGQDIIEFIKNSLSREDRYKNAVLKWTLKPSFNHLFSTFNKGGVREILDKSGLSKDLGRCPVCSAPPGMAIVAADEEEGSVQRYLSCCFCGYRWLFSISACPACGNDKPEKHGFFVGDAGCEQGTRAISCEECNTYIKTVFTGCREDGKRSYDLDMDIEDVATLSLDVIANQRGYTALCQR